MSSSFYPHSDFLNFHSPSDVIAPHPDLFELDLEKELAGLDPLLLPQQQFKFDEQPGQYAIPRGDLSGGGTPSTITGSSESASAYESLSSLSESFHNYAPTDYSFSLDIDMNFQSLAMRPASDYAQTTATSLSALDPNSDGSYATEHSPASSLLDEHDAFESLPPTSPATHNGSVYSDYMLEVYPPMPSHPSLSYTSSTVAPSTISTSSTSVASRRDNSPIGSSLPYVSRMSRGSDARTHVLSHGSTTSNGNSHLSESNDDPRKKYQCPQCPRAFARAYNLKTHMSTHDPNRLKPHVCPYRSCGRSFSRKHDLGRHLVSIHRDDPQPTATGDVKVGVANLKEGREWCDRCGGSNSPGRKGCNCVDVK